MAAAAESLVIVAKSLAIAAESIAAAVPGQPTPGGPSLTRSCASTAGGTSEATLPP